VIGHAASSGRNQHVDLVVIGSGAAAFAAAIRARELGARVVMVERGTVGGTCVNIGCVPSKTLLRGAETFYYASHQPFEGVQTTAVSADYGAMVAQKDRLVTTMRQEKYANLIGEYDWELVQGEARFLDPSTIAVGERQITADAFLIATGARPAVPPIPGLADAGYLTSTSAMELDRLPSSLIVIGAGYIALELGQVFRHLGSEVTLLQRGSRLLVEYEPEVAGAVEAMLQRLGTRALTGSHVQRVERSYDAYRLLIQRNGREETLDAEQILVATGRQPNVEVLDLAVAGVELDEHGAPKVSATLRTTNPRIFAAGDVTLAPQFVYVAAHEGRLAAENALNGATRPVDLGAVPSVIFTDPQIAAVGLSRAEAEARGFDVRSVVLPIDAVPRALVNDETEGVFTLVADATTDQLLGVQIVANNAGDVIYAATLAVKHHLTIRDLTESFAPYLTMAEGLKLGALAFERDVSKLSCCAA
jgi:mercuric reductase